MKKIIALVLSLVMVLGLAACGTDGPATETAGSETKILRVALAEDTSSINPFDRLDGVGRALWMPVYESLFDYDEDVAPYCRLAESYTLDEDGLGITINLRKGVKFHNGEEMTADDVMFSLKLGLESNWASAYGDINYDECEIIDEYTVHFAYNSVQGPLLYQLCYVYVLNEDNYNAVQEGTEENYVGTGAYQWSDWTIGLEYNMVRFDDYWGGEKYFDELNMRIIPDAAVAMLELESGGVDMIQRPNASDVERIMADPDSGFVVWQGSRVKNMSIGFNVQASPTDDILVREAIVSAINPEEILEIAFAGVGEVATNVVPSGISAWEAYGDGSMYTYDVEHAKELLAEAGYPDGITISLYYLNTSDMQHVAEVLIGQLAQAGITVESHQMESAALMDLQMNTNDTAMYLRILNFSGDPNQVINIAWSPADGGLGSQNYFRNENEACAEEFIAINDEAQVTQDMDARNELYRQLFDMIVENVWCYSLVDYGENFIMRSDIEGFWTGGVAFHYEDAYIAS